MRLYLKSRRIGISYTSAFQVAEQSMARPGLSTNIFSRDEELAQEFVRYIVPWTTCYNILAEENFIDKRSVKVQGLVFPNGSRVTAFSAAPDRAVGKSGSSWLDEFQSHVNGEKLWSYVLPTKAWGGQITVIGTMRGGTLFSDFCNDAQTANSARWSFHKTTLDDALDQGFLKKINAKRRHDGWPEYSTHDELKSDFFAGLDDSQIRQEFYCEAVEKIYRVFQENILDRQMMDESKLFFTPNMKKGLTYLGFDVGAIRDRTSICVVEVIGEKIYVRMLKTLDQGTEFSTMQTEMKKAVDAWTPEKIIIDTTTIGISLGQWAMGVWGNTVTPENSRVVAATLSGMSREKIIVNCQSLLEGGRLYIPATSEIRRQFLSISKKITVEGWVRYTIPRTAAGHADDAMAISLACYGVSAHPGDIIAQRLQKPSPGKQKWGKDPHRHPEDATAY
jgi:phage FluMu gp28-like protein